MNSDGEQWALDLLTERELEILQHISAGNSDQEIAQQLYLSVNTVKWYNRQIYSKLGVSGRKQAVTKARDLNLLDTHVSPVTDASDGRGHNLPEPENPYKGLQAFTAADEQDFFGRERLVKNLLKRLGEKHKLIRFLAVVGPSGSGKSSLVKAGLIPALWRGDLAGSESWQIVDIVPGARPLDELEVALTRIATDRGINLSEHLRRDAAGLLRAVGLVLPNDGSEILLVIDQFEEVFNLVEDEEECNHFLNLIYNAITDPRSRIRVVITLRADFYDRPLQYPQFGDLMRRRMETILPMGTEELTQAIRNPAERVGVKFEQGLVTTIVAEINHQPGALPLLQYALTELFENRENRTLTHAAYQQIGLAAGALANRAEETYQEFDQPGQSLVRQMFLRLVILGKGVEDTRRRVNRRELLAIADDPNLMDEIINTFAAYRLLALDHDPITRRPTVEVAHEALLQVWERLREWLNENRADIRLQRQLAHAAGEWQKAGQDPSFLLRGARLEQFEGWSALTALALTQYERDFLEASIAYEQKRKAEVIAAQQRFQRVLMALAIVFLIATLVSGGLALRVNTQRIRAEEAEIEALRQASVGLAGQAELEIERQNADIALLLALEALENYPYTWQAENALSHALQGSRLRYVFSGHREAAPSVAFSPDGEYFASAGWDGTTRILDPDTGEEVNVFASFDLDDWSWGLDYAHYVAWSADGTRVIISYGGGWEDAPAVPSLARIWDVNTGEILQTLSGHEMLVRWADWSPDETLIATTSDDGTARIWDAETGQELLVLPHMGFGTMPDGQEYRLGRAAWSPDSKYLLTTGGDGTAKVWDVRTGEERFTVSVGWPLMGAAWSLDGLQVATGSTTGDVDIWDASTGENIMTLSGHTDFVFDIAWSPDGKQIATASWDATARLWDAYTGEEIQAFTGHNYWVMGVDWSPDGRQLVTIGRTHSPKLWDLSDEVELIAVPLGSRWAVAWSPDGLEFATSDGTTTAIREAETGAEVLTFSAGVDEMLTISWSPDGQYVAAAGMEGTIRVWNPANGEQLFSLEGHQTQVEHIAWSPDSAILATSSTDTIVKLWDVHTREEIFSFSDYQGLESALFLKWTTAGDKLMAHEKWSGMVTAWDITTKAQLFEFSIEDYLNGAEWSPDGSQIVTFGVPGMHLWDGATGEQITHLFDEWWTNTAHWSQDGTQLVSGDDFGMVRLWDMDTHQQTLNIFAGIAPAKVIYSPDETLFAAALYDRTIILIEADTGIIRMKLYGHTDVPGESHWSPAGNRLLSVGVRSELTARLWRIFPTTQDMIDHARTCCVFRDLSPEERDLYGLPSVDSVR